MLKIGFVQNIFDYLEMVMIPNEQIFELASKVTYSVQAGESLGFIHRYII